MYTCMYLSVCMYVRDRHNVVLCSGGICGNEEEGQMAIISRTNAALFTEMVKICNTDSHLRVGFAGVSDMTCMLCPLH